MNEEAEDFLDRVRDAMQGMTYEALNKEVNGEVSHCIGMAVPSKNRTKPVSNLYTFVSRGVEHEWRLMRKRVRVPSLRNQYQKCVEEGLPPGTCGAFFERLVLALLLDPAQQPLDLYDVVPVVQKSSERIDVKGIEEVTFSGSDASAVKKVKKPTVFVPTNQQFPFIDFLIVFPSNDVIGIQATVNQRGHQPTPSTFKTVVDSLKSPLTLTKIVWAVPRGSGILKRQPLDVSTTRASKALTGSLTASLTASKALRDAYDKIPQYLLVV
jgi:hypothetical protein